jgi:hypothetical protein
MNAAILCPGPSLANWPDATWQNHNLIIGVNRAVLRYHCNWWAAADWPMVKKHDPGYRVRLWTNADTYKHLCGLTMFRERMELHSFDEANNYLDPIQWRWTGKTATAALILAAHQRATQIDVYGADWTDQPDYDGVTFPGTDRGEHRWKGERDVWESLCGKLAESGITVTRHGLH